MCRSTRDNSMQWTDSWSLRRDLDCCFDKITVSSYNWIHWYPTYIIHPNSAGCLILGPICTYSEPLRRAVFDEKEKGTILPSLGKRPCLPLCLATALLCLRRVWTKFEQLFDRMRETIEEDSTCQDRWLLLCRCSATIDLPVVSIAISEQPRLSRVYRRRISWTASCLSVSWVRYRISSGVSSRLGLYRGSSFQFTRLGNTALSKMAVQQADIVLWWAKVW